MRDVAVAELVDAIDTIVANWEQGDLADAVRYAEDAALIVGNTDGGTVKWQGRIVWREGREEYPACDYVDWAGSLMHDRIRAINERAYARRLARLEVTA